MKALIALVILVVVGLIGTLMVRLGSFKPVTISETDQGPIKLVFKKHVGAYHKIVPVIEEVEKWAKANGEPCTFSFGEFIDDPDRIAEDRLRSTGGCIVNKTWDFVLPAGFGFRELPLQHYVMAEFDGAPSIGPMKVYPKAKEYIAAHGFQMIGPTYEVYRVLSPDSVKTTYYFPVSKKAASPTERQ